MSTSIEERVTVLEEELTNLKHLLRENAPSEKNWRKTFGMSADDPEFDEMIQLGKAIRAQDCADDS